jgi:hypothetical protein
MPTFDLVAFLNSTAGDVTISVILMGLGALVTAWFKQKPEVKADATMVADVIAFIEPKVAQLEAVKMPGADKADLVLRAAGKFLDDQGIHGDARAAIERDLPQLLEVALAKVRAATANAKA